MHTRLGWISGAAAFISVGVLFAGDEPAQNARTINDLSWLSGEWRTEAGKGPVFEEHWMSPAGGVICGMGRMVGGDRLIFFEYLRISQEKDGSIVYHAMPMGRGAPTPFTLTSLEGTKVVFENPQHDDPKVITYTLDGDRLTAVTEGEKNGKPTRNTFSMKRYSK